MRSDTVLEFLVEILIELLCYVVGLITALVKKHVKAVADSIVLNDGPSVCNVCNATIVATNDCAAGWIDTNKYGGTTQLE